MEFDASKTFNAIGVALVLLGILYFGQTVFQTLGAEAKILLLFCVTIILFLGGVLLKGRGK